MTWGKTAPSNDPKKLGQEALDSAKAIDRDLPVNEDTTGVVNSLTKLAIDLNESGE